MNTGFQPQVYAQLQAPQFVQVEIPAEVIQQFVARHVRPVQVQ